MNVVNLHQCIIFIIAKTLYRLFLVYNDLLIMYAREHVVVLLYS